MRRSSRSGCGTCRDFEGNPKILRCFDKLPRNVQELAVKQYRIWQRDPFHPSLQFKQLKNDIWSVRVGQHHRAMAKRSGEMVVWFWIGTHEQYNTLAR